MNINLFLKKKVEFKWNTIKDWSTRIYYMQNILDGMLKFRNNNNEFTLKNIHINGHGGYPNNDACQFFRFQQDYLSWVCDCLVNNN